MVTLSFLAFGPTVAAAGDYNPHLALAAANATTAGTRHILELAGTWEFDDLVEVDFPAALVVSQGARFVRYRLNDRAAVGTSDTVVDGLASSEIDELEAAATSYDDGARVLSVDAHRLKVALPGWLEPGRIAAQLYVVLQHELPEEHATHFVSNRLEALVGEEVQP